MVLGVAVEIWRNLGTIKEKVLEKLALASVQVDGLENARHLSVIRDMSLAAHGLTKDALFRIKTHLVDLLPSLSPNVNRKMVDDAEEEASGHSREGTGGEEDIEEDSSKAAPYLSPMPSLFSSLVKPLSSRL